MENKEIFELAMQKEAFAALRGGLSKAKGMAGKAKTVGQDFIGGARMKPLNRTLIDHASYKGINIPKATVAGNYMRHKPMQAARYAGGQLGSAVRSHPYMAAGIAGGAGALGGAGAYRGYAQHRIENMSPQQRMMAALAALFNPQALANRF